MDIEVLVWTLVFFGGTLLVLLFLLFWAVKKDREKARATDADTDAGETDD